MNPKVSIVMTTYNRAHLLERTLGSIFSQEFKDFEVIIVDDGTDKETPELCEHYPHPVRYFKRVRHPGTFYSNPAVPNNIGLKRALGELVILQNAECMHVSPEVIASMVAATPKGTSTFAQVAALKPDDSFEQWYIHSTYNPRPFFFCQALHRDVINQLRGFDEDYLYYGYDDNDFADRLAKVGVKFQFSDDIKVNHLWHPTSFKVEDLSKNGLNAILYQRKSMAMQAGTLGVERNLDREWGAL